MGMKKEERSKEMVRENGGECEGLRRMRKRR